MPALADFKPGMSVKYVPNHAEGDETHKDCENGIVSSVGVTYVFVKFSLEGTTAQACDPSSLVIRP